jgi:hypothetical protein
MARALACLMNEIDMPSLEVAMRKVILIGVAGVMLAASAAAGSSAATSSTKLIVAMRDPGCHWFYVGGGPSHRKYFKTLTRTGPVTLVNLDEATLIIKGPGGTRHEKVGAELTLKAKGIYRITMVKQAPDDNHLKLTIR